MTMTRILLALACLTAALSLGSGSATAQYYGDKPWCAVVAATDGEMTWKCFYNSVAECTPHVLAGDRGFCNVNPYGSSPAATTTPARRRKHGAAS
jgi:hypothetical protein